MYYIIKIKNLIVNNGIREYDFNEIHSNKKIFQLANTVFAWHQLEPLSEKINSENGIVYITTNTEFSHWKADLKNVSIELLDLWHQSKP